MKIEEVKELLRKGLVIYPQVDCIYTSTKLCELGFPIVVGYFETNNYCGLEIHKRIPHFWNEIPNRNLDLDISGYQFRIHQKHLSELEKNKDIEIWVPKERKDYIAIERGLKSIFK